MPGGHAAATPADAAVTAADGGPARRQDHPDSQDGEGPTPRTLAIVLLVEFFVILGFLSAVTLLLR